MFFLVLHIDLEYIILDFSKFTFSPDALQKLDKILDMRLIWEFFAFMKNKLLSAKKRYKIPRPPQNSCTGFHVLSATLWKN